MSVESCEDTLDYLGCTWEWESVDGTTLLHVDHGPDAVTGTIEGDSAAECARKWEDIHAAAIDDRDGLELDPVLHPGQPGDLMETLLRTMGVPS